FIRYFPGARTAPGHDPWSAHFSLGTNISSGLAEARRMAEHEGHVAKVLLISDLGDSPTDLEPVRREVVALVRDGIAVEARVLPGSLPADRARFRTLLGREAVGDSTGPSRTSAAALAPAGSAPHGLVLLAVAAAAVLALSELFGASLRWREEHR